MNWLIGLNILIVLIIIIRALASGKISRKLQYAIWISLPIFILVSTLVKIPVNVKVPKEITTDHQLFNSHEYDDSEVIIVPKNRFEMEVKSDENSINSNTAVINKTKSIQKAKENILVSQPPLEFDSSKKAGDTNSVRNSKNLDYRNMLSIIWFTGSVVTALFLFTKNLFFARLIHKNRKFYAIEPHGNLKVYVLNTKTSPFLMGKSIYIPAEIALKTKEYEYSICHEYCHYRQLDFIWIVVEFVFLAVFWFNPLIWISYVLIQHDCEMSVDETVISIMGSKDRANYSRTLLNMMIESGTNSFVIAATSANGRNKKFIKTRILSIMKDTKRSIAASMAAIISIAGLVGCAMLKPVKNPVRDMEYVEDSEWFETNVYSTECYKGCHGAYGENVIFIDKSSFIACESFNVNGTPESQFFTKYSIDSEGGCNKDFSIDLRECGLEYYSDDYVEYSAVRDSEYINEKFYFVVNKQYVDDAGNITVDTYVQEINLDDGTLGKKIINDSISTVFDVRNFINQSYVYDDKLYYLMNSNGEYKLVTMNSDFELENEIGLKDVGIYNYACILDGYFIINSINAKERNEVFVYDIQTGEFDIINNPPALLMKYNWKSSNLGMSYCDSTGIYSYDLKENYISQKIDFNLCNVNNKDFNPSATHVTEIDDRVFTWRVIFENGGLQYKIYEFEKADSNPNVGKGIVKIADLDGLYDVSECIRLFNEKSENTYLVIDDRYVINDYIEGIEELMASNNYTGTDEYKVAYRKAKSTISSKLMIDILAGEGPDIILNAFELEELNRSQYLVNLNDVLVESNLIDPSKYIPAIFNTYDELYQMPLEVHGEGIMWDRRFMSEGDNSISLTYKEYDELVSDICNGHDPISLRNNRTDYLLTMFNNYFDDFVRDGKVDINNDEFKEMASFVSSRPELSEEETSNDISLYIDPVAVCGGPDLGFISDYFTTAFPTDDGHGGIKLSCNLSIAITKSCPLMDEAAKFIVDTMEYYSEYIRIQDIHEASIETITEYNNRVKAYPELFRNPVEINESLADDYIDVLLLADGFVKSDSDINVILAEEIQPYFAGDKSIEEVIEIIEDRAQTVIDERS